MIKESVLYLLLIVDMYLGAVVGALLACSIVLRVQKLCCYTQSIIPYFAQLGVTFWKIFSEYVLTQYKNIICQNFRL